jgi:membrane protease YdiL (CAAX protease family)
VPRLELLLKSSFLAIVISSVLFSIAHIGFGNAAQMINTGFIGIISAWYFVKYRNIKILIATHFLIDLIGVYSKFR